MRTSVMAMTGVVEEMAFTASQFDVAVESGDLESMTATKRAMRVRLEEMAAAMTQITAAAEEEMGIV